MSTKAIEPRDPITHELKCHPPQYRAVKDGNKPFEWRKDDRGYRVGDTLWLREWYPGDTPSNALDRTSGYTGESVHRLVTYVIREGFGIPEGYCIMGLSDLQAQGEGEAVAWMTDDGRVANTETRNRMPPPVQEIYHISLYTRPAPDITELNKDQQ